MDKIKTTFYCDAHEGEVTETHYPFTTGYAVDENGGKVCYICSAKIDVAYMRKHGRIALNLTVEDEDTPYYRTNSGKLTNWPGSLVIRAGQVKKGRHNIAGSRYDTWFIGPDGYRWHAVQYGEDNEVAHCKRTKHFTGKGNFNSITIRDHRGHVVEGVK